MAIVPSHIYLFLLFCILVCANIAGNQRYGPVDFSGTMFVNTDKGLDYIGFVFGYQSNKKFYAVLWRHKNLNLKEKTYKAGIKGLQLKVCFKV